MNYDPFDPAMDEAFKKSLNGKFIKNNKTIGYARVERVETGLKFPMLKLVIGFKMEDLVGTRLDLYHRRDDVLVESVEITHPIRVEMVLG